MEYYNQVTPDYINALKNSVVKYKLKVELMDYRERVIDEITQDISSQDSGSISINYQQGVRRSCSINLINTFKKYSIQPNSRIWVQTKFKVYIGVIVTVPKILDNKLLYGANQSSKLLYSNQKTDNLVYRQKKIELQEDTYWFSQGVFLLTNPNDLIDGSKRMVTINGVDKFGAFGSETNFHETEGTYLIPAGTTVGAAIRDILNLNLGNGYQIDPITPYIDAEIGAIELPYDIKKSPETHFAEMLIEMGNVFACDIYYDTDGVLNFRKGNEQQNMSNYPSIWNFDGEQSKYFSPTVTSNFSDMYNVIKVIGNNEGAPDIYEYILKNTDLSSPTCVQTIGEKIKYIESSFCYNLERTKDFAKYLLRKNSIIQQQIDFQSFIIPHIDVNNIVDIDNEYFGYEKQRFVIQAITIPFGTKSLMDISASNVATIPYFEY